MEHIHNEVKNGLAPWIDGSSSVLILGTLPGDKSISEQCYYQNPRNSFWKIMNELFEDYNEDNQKEFLLSHKIALWDCLKNVKREGSMDSGIHEEGEEPNDLEALLRKYPSVKTIILNGKTETLKRFDKYFLKLRNDYKVIALNSTSGANSSIKFEEKLAEWKIIKKYL